LQPLRRFSFRSGRQVSSMPWRVRDRRCGLQGLRWSHGNSRLRDRTWGLVILAPCDAVLGYRRRRLLNSSRDAARNARNEQPFRQYRLDAHGDAHGRPDSALLDWVPNRSASEREIGSQPPIVRSSQLSFGRSSMRPNMPRHSQPASPGPGYLIQRGRTTRACMYGSLKIGAARSGYERSSPGYLLLALDIRCADELSPLVEVGLDDLLEIFRRTPFRIDTKRCEAPSSAKRSAVAA
jgi:hypothetical protein